MATHKQVGYIISLTKKLGKDVKYNEIQKLSDKNASAVIDDLKKQLEGSKDNVRNEPVKKYSDVKLGMAEKLVTQHYINCGRLPTAKQTFMREVQNLLEMFDCVEKELNDSNEGGEKNVN